MRGPKLDSFIKISAGGSKFVVFVKIGFETCENIFLCVFNALEELINKVKKKLWVC